MPDIMPQLDMLRGVFLAGSQAGVCRLTHADVLQAAVVYASHTLMEVSQAIEEEKWHPKP